MGILQIVDVVDKIEEDFNLKTEKGTGSFGEKKDPVPFSVFVDYYLKNITEIAII